jgi:transposase
MEHSVMGRRSDKTPQERADIVLALLRREEPASVLARRHGISEPTLYRWRDDFLEAGRAGLSASAQGKRAQASREQELERELFERDRVIGELTIANRFLKKTTDPTSTWYTGKKS